MKLKNYYEPPEHYEWSEEALKETDNLTAEHLHKGWKWIVAIVLAVAIGVVAGVLLMIKYVL